MNNQLNWSDVFKSSFLERSIASFSLVDVLMTLGLALVSGFAIYMVYKRSYSGVLYSRTFNISLIGISLITSILIMAITSNIVLSLGMVGALSIVRFRAAIKDPLDIVYLFWAIAQGIIFGAGLFLIGIVSCLIVGAVLLLFSNSVVSDNPYLLIVSCTGAECEANINNLVKESFKKFYIKSKAVKPGGNIELSIEVRMKDQETDFVNKISEIEGVTNAVLVSYNGEFAA